MKYPKLICGGLEHRIGLVSQYILKCANLTNGSYNCDDFLNRINKVDYNSLSLELKNDVKTQREFMNSILSEQDEVIINYFDKDDVGLQYFIDSGWSAFYGNFLNKNFK